MKNCSTIKNAYEFEFKYEFAIDAKLISDTQRETESDYRVQNSCERDKVPTINYTAAYCQGSTIMIMSQAI